MMYDENTEQEKMEQEKIEQEKIEQETQYYRRADSSYIPNEPKRSDKKSSSFGMKLAGITAAALLFGVISGGTMVGVNWIANGFKNQMQSQETTEPLVELPTAAEKAVAEKSTAQAVPALAMDVSAIVEGAMPSIVAINSTMLYESQANWFTPSQSYEVPGSGSGIIIGKNDTELLIVTNNHVVADAQELKVVFIDDTTLDATIKGTNSETDLAVVAVPVELIPAETLNQISAIAMGDSDSLKVGQGVIAIGNALGYGQSVTVGYVSALNREVGTSDGTTTRNLLQTDAAINPGNSGGALINMQGELIGINAAKYSSTEVEGMGYAIPISQAGEIISDLMNRKTRTLVEEENRGYLGIQGLTVDQEMAKGLDMPKGTFVYKLTEGGAASKSTLRERDVITKVDGQSISSMEDLQKMLTYYEAGTTVSLTVQSIENGQYVERQVDITLSPKSEAMIN